MPLPITIRSIGTAVPDTVIAQDSFRDVLAGQPGNSRLATRLVRTVFDASAITTRHTVIDELATSGPATPGTGDARSGDDVHPTFFDRAEGRVLTPGTAARNELYIEESRPLLVEAARAALAAAPDLGTGDVTHVITVSCTGFYAPGPDYVLVRDLGLDVATQRYHLGFMGCYGAFPALRAARQFCLADPMAVVLVVCVELCSLHLTVSDDPDTIIANSVFADGAAAALVTGRPAPRGSTVLELDAFETVLTPTGEQDMAWKIGDHGFEMTLSSYVPHIIEAHVKDALAPLVAAVPALDGVAFADIERWAVHPGGRSILDRVERALELAPAQLTESRAVLAEFGNMSSATVLFVLQRILEVAGAGNDDDRAERVCAMAFGPGLTLESGIMTRRVAA